MRLFISYNTKDESAVRPVVDRLETLRPDADIYFAPTPQRRGQPVDRHAGRGAGGVGRGPALPGSRTSARGRRSNTTRLSGAAGASRRRASFRSCWRTRRPGCTSSASCTASPAKDVGTEELLTRIGVALDGVEAGPDAVPLWRETNPYRGLHAMESSDAAFFFGREALTGDLLERLRGRPDKVQLLVGNSGTGKSSIVEAGVVAALRSQVWPGDPDRPWPEDMADSRSWQPVRMTPGREPLKALASAFIRIWTDDSADREALALKWAENFRNGSGLDALIAAAAEELGKRPDAGVPARLLLNIDQGEELYVRDGTGSEEERTAKAARRLGAERRPDGRGDVLPADRGRRQAARPARHRQPALGLLRPPAGRPDAVRSERADRRAAADPGTGRGRHPQAGGRPRRAVRRSEDRADDRRGHDAGRRARCRCSPT